MRGKIGRGKNQCRDMVDGLKRSAKHLKSGWKQNYLQIFQTCLKVFCLTSRRSLTDYLKKTSGSVSSDIQSPRFNKHARYPSTDCVSVQKRMAESRVTLRGDIPNRWRSVSSDIRKKWKVKHESPVGCFIQYPATSWNLQNTSGSVSTDIKTQRSF